MFLCLHDSKTLFLNVAANCKKKKNVDNINDNQKAKDNHKRNERKIQRAEYASIRSYHPSQF